MESQYGMNVQRLAGCVDRLNIRGDPTPEAGGVAAISAGVGATSCPAYASGFSTTEQDDNTTPIFTQEGTQMDPLRGGAPGAGPAGGGGSMTGQHDKDNDVEGKLFIGGISWQTTEEGLRYACVCCWVRLFAVVAEHTCVLKRGSCIYSCASHAH